MTRIYSIHLVIPFDLGIRIIPKFASTQYSYDIYPTKHKTPKTHAGFVHKPMIQRKSVKDERPITPTEKIILGPIVEAPKTRGKFRKNINKDALAKYFDNDIVPSRAETAQEELDTWLMQTMFELDWADIEKAKQIATEEEIRDFVEAVRNPKNIALIEVPAHYASSIQDEYNIDTDNASYLDQYFDYAAEIDERDSRLDTTEINSFIADRFVKKHSGADTAAAMRALHKHRKGIEQKYMSHQIQRTK